MVSFDQHVVHTRLHHHRWLQLWSAAVALVARASARSPHLTPYAFGIIRCLAETPKQDYRPGIVFPGTHFGSIGTPHTDGQEILDRPRIWTSAEYVLGCLGCHLDGHRPYRNCRGGLSIHWSVTTLTQAIMLGAKSEGSTVMALVNIYLRRAKMLSMVSSDNQTSKEQFIRLYCLSIAELGTCL